MVSKSLSWLHFKPHCLSDGILKNKFQLRTHTEKFFLHIVEWTLICIVITLFRLILAQNGTSIGAKHSSTRRQINLKSVITVHNRFQSTRLGEDFPGTNPDENVIGRIKHVYKSDTDSIHACLLFFFIETF